MKGEGFLAYSFSKKQSRKQESYRITPPVSYFSLIDVNYGWFDTNKSVKALAFLNNVVFSYCQYKCS